MKGWSLRTGRSCILAFAALGVTAAAAIVLACAFEVAHSSWRRVAQLGSFSATFGLQGCNYAPAPELLPAY